MHGGDDPATRPALTPCAERRVDAGRPGRVRPEQLAGPPVAREGADVVAAQLRGPPEVEVRLAEPRRAAERQRVLVVGLGELRGELDGAARSAERLSRRPSLRAISPSTKCARARCRPARQAQRPLDLGARAGAVPERPERRRPGRPRSAPRAGGGDGAAGTARRPPRGRRGARRRRRAGRGRARRPRRRARRTRAAPAPARRCASRIARTRSHAGSGAGGTSSPGGEPEAVRSAPRRVRSAGACAAARGRRTGTSRSPVSITCSAPIRPRGSKSVWRRYSIDRRSASVSISRENESW